MKAKELKNLAKKIAVQERIAQETDDGNIRARAEQEIMKLTSHVESIEDITALDEYVLQILENT